MTLSATILLFKLAETGGNFAHSFAGATQACGTQKSHWTLEQYALAVLFLLLLLHARAITFGKSLLLHCYSFGLEAGVYPSFLFVSSVAPRSISYEWRWFWGVWGVGVEAEGDRTKGGLKISARCRILNQSEGETFFTPFSPSWG